MKLDELAKKLGTTIEFVDGSIDVKGWSWYVSALFNDSTPCCYEYFATGDVSEKKAREKLAKFLERRMISNNLGGKEVRHFICPDEIIP